jgi:hypothetical protein
LANVPNTSLHSFTDGETVTKDMLNQDIQVLQTAVNDNNQRISTLQQASIGQMSAFASGTVVPVSPAPVVGQVFYRTDIGPTGTLYVYDTTSNWNSDPSEIKRALGLGLTANPNTISTGDLNTYTTSGFYAINGTVTNVPISSQWGYLQVQVWADTSRVGQTFIHDAEGTVWQRTYFGGSWTTWIQISGNPVTTTVPLQAGWSSYDGSVPWVWKDNMNMVHLRMFIKGGTTTFSTTIATIPAAFLPSHGWYINCQGSDSTKSYLVNVNTNGNVTIQTSLDATWTLIDAAYPLYL